MTIINGGYREYRLDNGLLVALQSTPTETVAAELRINYGPSHEKEGEEEEGDRPQAVREGVRRCHGAYRRIPRRRRNPALRGMR